MNDEGTGKVRVGAQKGWEWIRWILIPLLAWGALEISDLSARVSVIEANRFTSEDGLELWKALGERPLRDDVPPAWFVSRVDKLEGRLDRIEEKLP